MADDADSLAELVTAGVGPAVGRSAASNERSSESAHLDALRRIGFDASGAAAHAPGASPSCPAAAIAAQVSLGEG